MNGTANDIPPTRTKVVIIGAGPTGLSLAAQMLRYNIDFIILEKNENTTPLSKAIVLQARSLEIFQEIGLAKKAIEEGSITTALNIFHKGEKKATVNVNQLGKGITAFPYALSLEQSKTEKLLADHLTENGINLHWKCEFTHFEQNENTVSVFYKDKNGQGQKIDAAYLVGCDGAHSLVRHQAGMAFDGDTVPKLFYVADVKLRSSVLNKDELFIFLIKKGFVIFFPMEGTGHYRIVGILPDKKDDHENIQFSDIEPGLKKDIIAPVEFEETRWFATYKVHSRKANSFMNGRCFIAGDAAHIHTPAGGQGMNTGIQDAYNLAWKLAYVINKKLDPAILKTYDTERMENAKHLLHTTDRMFDIMAGTNPLWNFLRLNIFPLVAAFISGKPKFNKIIFPLISQTGIAYSNSALTIKSNIGNIRSGNRMPYFEFTNGKNIYEFIPGTNFKIIYFGSLQYNCEVVVSQLNFEIQVFEFAEIPKSVFGNENNFYILLRPDNHIMYIGKEVTKCIIFLKQFQYDDVKK